MKEHVPVPVAVLERLLDRERAVGGKFSREMALTDMMLDWVTGRRRSRQDYADIWMWSKSAVNRAMPGLYDEAESLLSFRLEALIEEADTDITMPDLFPGMPKTPPAKPPDRRDRRLNNRPFFEKKSWQYVFAMAFAQKLQREGISTRQFRERPAVALQDYARTFDELNRIDGHSRETIVRVVRYLFNDDDFWIRTNNLQSANQLRRKKNAQGEYVFDQLLRKMEHHDARNSPNTRSRVDEIRDETAASIERLRSRS